MVKNQRRQPLLDPAVADLLSGMEKRQAEAQLPRRQREKIAKERAKIQARRQQRVTYDLPPVVRQTIKSLAEKESVPASQVVTLALLRFLKAYQEGIINLGEIKESSRSPRYDWNLIFPDDMMPKK
ncbi:MAG: hypothetical protein K8R77_06825 [Anaerolineaceae bacterium]|nr:hypothetical protein [Anaerolineaceae bacterium]